MKKFLAFIIIAFTAYFFFFSEKDEKKNFVQIYSEVLLLQLKEEFAKKRDLVFSKKDSLLDILKNYDISEEVYQELVKENIKDLDNWKMIQDSATSLLKKKLMQLDSSLTKSN